jgi:hypothetical protein
MKEKALKYINRIPFEKIPVKFYAFEEPFFKKLKDIKNFVLLEKQKRTC